MKSAGIPTRLPPRSKRGIVSTTKTAETGDAGKAPEKRMRTKAPCAAAAKEIVAAATAVEDPAAEAISNKDAPAAAKASKDAAATAATKASKGATKAVTTRTTRLSPVARETNKHIVVVRPGHFLARGRGWGVGGGGGNWMEGVYNLYVDCCLFDSFVVTYMPRCRSRSFICFV